MQKSQQLYEAHVQFMVAQCSGRALITRIHDEIIALRGWLDQVTLNRFIQKERLLETIKKTLVDYPLDGENIARHRHELILDIN